MPSSRTPAVERVDVSIVMPVFNEEATVVEAIKRALDVGMPAAAVEVVVVDDGSTDSTVELIKTGISSPQVKLVVLGSNHGKGFAVRAGVEHASGKYVAVLDADFEYDVRDFAEMLPRLVEDGADAVIGTRVWRAQSAYGYWYVVGNKFINTVCNMLYNTYLSDFGACLKMLPTETFRSLPLKENGFGFDAELVARLLRSKAKVFEVPVFYRARSREEGKKITSRDGLKILFVFIRCRFR